MGKTFSTEESMLDGFVGPQYPTELGAFDFAFASPGDASLIDEALLEAARTVTKESSFMFTLKETLPYTYNVASKELVRWGTRLNFVTPRGINIVLMIPQSPTVNPEMHCAAVYVKGQLSPDQLALFARLFARSFVPPHW